MKNQMKTLTVIAMFLTFAMASSAHAEWTVDLSRRTQQMRKKELVPSYDVDDRAPASVRTFEGEEPPMDGGTWKTEGAAANAKGQVTPEPGFIDRILDPGEPSQDIVILNTERGFVPNTIRIRKDGRYTIHVVNVNEKEKNVSFILDGFSEHHATFFGKVKTFKLEPRKEGVYSFLSPETAVEGRFIVFAAGPEAAPKVRVPATAQLDGN